MKISRKDQKTLLYILGVLMVIAVYFLYYSSKQAELETLQGEVDKLYSEVLELEDYEINNNRYKNDMNSYYEQIDDMVDEFPAGIKEETSIIYGRGLETKYGMNVSSVVMTPSTLLSSFGVGERQKHLYSSTVTMNVSGSYEQIKNMIKDANENEDKRTITSISLARDSATGNLTGSVVMNLYSLSGKDRIFEEPDTGIDSHGTGNIFGQ